MHSRTVNRARIKLQLAPVTPLLVRSGDKGAALLHPERPKIMFVRTRPGGKDEKETVYLPGSSLKGVIRAAAERVLRSIAAERRVQQAACDPLDQKGPCHKDLRERGDALSREPQSPERSERMAEVHHGLCLACRTFGSTAAAARVLFADAYPTEKGWEQANAVEVRNSVAVDRRTGGPSPGALLDFEVVTGGIFKTEIHLSNFELWQLGLVLLVLEDMNEGFVRVGASKSRGLGHMKAVVTELVVDQARGAAGQLAGVGALLPTQARAYGWLESQGIEAGVSSEPKALGPRFVYKGEAVTALRGRLLGAPWEALCQRIDPRGPA